MFANRFSTTSFVIVDTDDLGELEYRLRQLPVNGATYYPRPSTAPQHRARGTTYRPHISSIRGEVVDSLWGFLAVCVGGGCYLLLHDWYQPTSAVSEVRFFTVCGGFFWGRGVFVFARLTIFDPYAATFETRNKFYRVGLFLLPCSIFLGTIFFTSFWEGFRTYPNPCLRPLR